jgi:hypothetical protein
MNNLIKLNFLMIHIKPLNQKLKIGIYIIQKVGGLQLRPEI